jgi:2-oxoglutarate ferredoxin oxidoreductase subunit alpha
MPAHNRVFVQAESELAAISMVYGAAATGKRSMTSSSSPGISLKQEGLSYIAGAELPMVIANIQRGGPGLGNIAPSQADYFQTVKGGGHGDYRLIVLAPSSVQEMHDFAALSFELSDKYRNPVMILSDGRIGQMMEPLTLSDRKPETVKKDWALTGAKDREPNTIRSFYMEPGTLEETNKRIQKKLKEIEAEEVRYESFQMEDAEVMFVAYGTSARLCKGVIRELRGEGIRTGLLRPISLWPFPSEIIRELSDKIKSIFVVEMNAGQMVEDVRLACRDRVPVHFHGRMGGGVPTTEEIITQLKQTL